jgi:endoglucanase
MANSCLSPRIDVESGRKRLFFAILAGLLPFSVARVGAALASCGGGAWPGLLSGGPNAGRQDAILRALPADLPPAKIYADHASSYASNEIAINWQASLVFLLAGELQ